MRPGRPAGADTHRRACSCAAADPPLRAPVGPEARQRAPTGELCHPPGAAVDPPPPQVPGSGGRPFEPGGSPPAAVGPPPSPSRPMGAVADPSRSSPSGHPDTGAETHPSSPNGPQGGAVEPPGEPRGTPSHGGGPPPREQQEAHGHSHVHTPASAVGPPGAAADTHCWEDPESSGPLGAVAPLPPPRDPGSPPGAAAGKSQRATRVRRW